MEFVLPFSELSQKQTNVLFNLNLLNACIITATICLTNSLTANPFSTLRIAFKLN